MTITLSEQHPLGKLFLPRTPFSVVCTGQREPYPVRPIELALRQLPRGSRILVGDCPTGVDPLVLKVAEQLDRSFTMFDAYWNCADYETAMGGTCDSGGGQHRGAPHGRPAGPARNRRMLDAAHTKDGDQVVVLAFHDDLDASRGTKDCVKQALNRQHGYLTMLVSRDERWQHVLSVT